MSLRDFFIAPPPAGEPSGPPPAAPHRDRRRRRPSRDTARGRAADRAAARISGNGFALPARDASAFGDGFAPPAPVPAGESLVSSSLIDGPRELVGAAVVGRPGEVEPLAAGIALVLRRLTAARAATVVVVGADDPPTGGAASPAARRLAARLAAHGFEHVAARGRLVWVHTTPPDAPRAALVGAPAVLAVTIPITLDLEATVTEQELVVVVTSEPDGPLAELACAALERPGLDVTAFLPLSRGFPRTLARAGLAAPRAMRELL